MALGSGSTWCWIIGSSKVADDVYSCQIVDVIQFELDTYLIKKKKNCRPII